MTILPEIEILRTGSFVGMGGHSVEIGATELAEIAGGYDNRAHSAPVVIGHPETNGPAYGVVAALRIVGDRLRATVDRIDPGFRDLVRAGRYTKISASLFKPSSPGNPKPGRWHLRHVGFLGAMAPAVKGLQAVALAERQRVPVDDPIALAELAMAHADCLAAVGIHLTAAEAVRSVLQESTP